MVDFLVNGLCNRYRFRDEEAPATALIDLAHFFNALGALAAVTIRLYRSRERLRPRPEQRPTRDDRLGNKCSATTPHTV